MKTRFEKHTAHDLAVLLCLSNDLITRPEVEDALSGLSGVL